MGRRALRRLDPTLDLAPFLFELEELPQPFDAESFFSRRAPLQVEVGSGKGLFLAGAAEESPHHNFLGIEVARRYARFCAGRLAKRALSNAKMVSGDGLRLFHEYLGDCSVAAVHVYFPDPWWKKRHHKRRVMQPPLLRDIERVLEPGGRLHFWTDVQEYYQGTLEIIAEVTRLSEPLPVSEKSPEHHLDYRTHFERRTRLHELPVYRAEFQKTRVGIPRS